MREDVVFVNPEDVKIEFVQAGNILIASANGSSQLVGKHALIHFVNNNTLHHLSWNAIGILTYGLECILPLVKNLIV